MESFVRDVRVPSARGTGRGERRRVAALYAGSSDDGAQERRSVAEKREVKRGGSGAGAALFCGEARRLRRGRGSLLRRSAVVPARTRLFFCEGARRLQHGRGSFLRRSAVVPARARLSSAEKRGGSGADTALFCGEARWFRRGRGSLLRRSAAAPMQARLSSAKERDGSDADTTLFCEGARRLRRGRGSFFAKGRGGSGEGAALFCGEARRLRRGRGSFLRSVGCEERRGGSLSVRRSSAGVYSVTVSPAGRETRWLFQMASPPSRLARTVSLPSFREISTCPSGRGSVPSKESAADASGATTKVA